MPHLARPAVRLVAAALLAALGACSTDANPVRDAVQGAGFGPKPAIAPDFVAASRPKSLDYMPVGRPGAAPLPKAKRADEVKGVEAEMDSLRARNEARGAEARRAGAGVKPPAPPIQPPATP